MNRLQVIDLQAFSFHFSSPNFELIADLCTILVITNCWNFWRSHWGAHQRHQTPRRAVGPPPPGSWHFYSESNRRLKWNEYSSSASRSAELHRPLNSSKTMELPLPELMVGTIDYGHCYISQASTKKFFHLRDSMSSEPMKMNHGGWVTSLIEFSASSRIANSSCWNGTKTSGLTPWKNTLTIDRITVSFTPLNTPERKSITCIYQLIVDCFGTIQWKLMSLIVRYTRSTSKTITTKSTLKSKRQVEKSNFLLLTYQTQTNGSVWGNFSTSRFLRIIQYMPIEPAQVKVTKRISFNKLIGI